ncbi:transcriptional regulator [Shewanella sp. BC20]|uniref:NadS family protein n=1 Tax=Shewanella sp. BC20 TaxID=2004459 RepID=UPI000D64F8D2|nr:NadS family protein [Shewanella sp. BC20]PWF64934.1 transcriptional regulator [Shewanella sp. BC20]
MNDELFSQLLESVQQMDEINQGVRQPSRETVVTSVQVKAIRQRTQLTQSKFAQLIDVNIGTLRNWEQGRREPTGPAKVLLRAIERDPVHVIAALG